MLKKSFFLFALFCFAWTISTAQTKKPGGATNPDKLLTALINSKEVRGMFGDDAMAAYASSPDLRRIFRLRKKAIPLLIAHLDDKRLLPLYSHLPDSKQVTIGAASLDLLTMIIRNDAPFYDQKCMENLMSGAEGHASDCADSKYAVLPDDFWNGSKLVVKKSVLRAKRRWQIAYRKNQIQYVKYEE